MSLLGIKNNSKGFKDYFIVPKSQLKERLLPIILFVIIVLLDQISKALIVAFIPHNPFNPESISLVGDWIHITHVRNQGIAWSGMRELSGFFRILLLITLPALFLILFALWTFFGDQWTKLQRYGASSIIAGGVGNLIDRIFRYASGPRDIMNGVVDWIDMAFFKIPHFTPTGRWPTFNVADSAVVIGVIILFLTMLIDDYKKGKANRSTK